MENFSQKYVVVTGGSRGIGKAIAKNFFERGATVLICARKLKDVKAVCKEIDPSGKRFFGIQADVSKVADCRKLIHLAVKKFGTIDVLINNAGIVGELNEFIETDLKQWTKAIEANLFGTVYCSRFALPVMEKAKKGKIINFAGAGVGGKKPLPHFSAYYTSKVALVGFTETLSAEVGARGIQVNCVAPGQINTGITDYLIAQGPQKAGLEMYTEAVEQKKKGESSMSKVTDLVAFLGSSDSDHITGRLISAKWDSIDVLKKIEKGSGLYKLRRIDNDLFYGK